MNGSWTHCKLEDAVKLIDYRGRTPVKTESGVRLITAKNVKLGYLQLEPQEFIAEENYPSWMTRGIPKVGDVIFTTEAPLANVAQIDTNEKLAFAQRIIVMQPNRSILDPTFLRYLLLSQNVRKKIFENGTGATVQGIKSSLLKKIEITFPEIGKQKRIVALLDECFAAIAKAKANAEQNLRNAVELFESCLASAFTASDPDWKLRRLEEIAVEFGRGKSKHRPRNDAKLYGGSYPFIQTGDVRNANKYIVDHSQTYNDIGLAQSKLWKKGTICITIAANIAETAILNFDACFPDSIIGLNVDPTKANLDFTYYLLQYFKSELQKLGKGSAQDNINLGTFENQKFPFPPLHVQVQVVQKLDNVRATTQKLEAVYENKINQLAELQKTILQKAFAGELVTDKVMEL